MAEIFDFNAYRTHRLLGNVFRQAERVCLDMADFEDYFSSIEDSLKEYARALQRMDVELREHQTFCEKVQVQNEECRKALERDNFDELIEVRNRLRNVRHGH